MKLFKPSLKQIGYFGAIGTVVFGFFCWFSPPKWLYWTGFKKDTEVSRTEKIIENGKEITVVTKDVSGKTLWDWLSVLGVPVSLAILGFLFQQQQQKIAESNQKEEVLQAYFDRLASLLVDKNLLAIAIKQGEASEEERELLSSAGNMIRARTLSILRKFGEDGGRKTSVIQFLMEAKIIRKLNLSLEGAYLVNADLSNADFRFDFSTLLFRESINLTYANFSHANLRRVIFSNADLNGTIFNNANLSNADIRGNDLTGAKLINACLVSTNLMHANLTSADLTNADLTNANLRESKLIGTNLSKARNLTLEQVAQAKLCKTKLPPDIQVDPNRDCKEMGIELR